VHRDIKPANIFDSTGQLKILDFRLAKLARARRGDDHRQFVRRVSHAGGVIPGCGVYVSEQADRNIWMRAAIFSFGVVLYEMATGKKPFTGTILLRRCCGAQSKRSARTVNPAVPVG
jgi:serine/threonine protein kinase